MYRLEKAPEDTDGNMIRNRQIQIVMCRMFTLLLHIAEPRCVGMDGGARAGSHITDPKPQNEDAILFVIQSRLASRQIPA